jgi:multiple sugar transport system substrate-binding protein
MKRVILLLATVLFFACGDGGKSVHLKFWAFGGSHVLNDWIRMRAEQFEAQYPDIKVTVSLKSWNMIRELLYTNFSAGTGPDLMRVHANYAAEFGENGFFYPIDQFEDFNEVQEWYVPHLFESVEYSGHYYGLPHSAIAFVLVCNKDMFDADNIKPPKTWSEFRRVAKHFTRDLDGDGSYDQYGLTLLGGDRGGFAYRLAPFFFKAGGDILSEDLTRVEFNGPECITALQLFADMYQIDRSITPGFLAYTLSECSDMFVNDKVAMAIEGPWYNNVIRDKNPDKRFYTVPVPVPDHRIDQFDTAPTLQDMVMNAINANTKHPDAAWAFLKFIRNEEADMAWVEQDMGAIAVTHKALSSDFAQTIADLPVYRQELKHARAWPSHPQMIYIVRNFIVPFGQQAIIGELTPEQALNKAAKEAQLILEGKK